MVAKISFFIGNIGNNYFIFQVKLSECMLQEVVDFSGAVFCCIFPCSIAWAPLEEEEFIFLIVSSLSEEHELNIHIQRIGRRNENFIEINYII